MQAVSGEGAGGKGRGFQKGDDGESGEAAEELEIRVLWFVCLFWDPTFLTARKISCLDFRTDILRFAEMSSDIGIYGLSTRAINLALNFAAKGLSVSVGHRSSDLVGRASFVRHLD